MRILTLSSLFPNSLDPAFGIFIYQRSAHVALLPGNEVEVVSPVPYVPRWLRIDRWRIHAALPKNERIGGLFVHHPRYFLLPKVSMWLHGLLLFLGSLRLVLKLHARAKFDCIDAHFVYPDGFAAVLLGKVLGIPVSVSARGTDINLYPSLRVVRSMIRWTLSEADEVIAVSKALKDAMIALGTDPGKIHVIPNGVDEERFKQVDQTEARRQLGLPVSARALVSIGALIPSKGHNLLIQAFERIALRQPDLKLYILGEGPARSTLEALIERANLQDRVQLIGKRPNEELLHWFSAADISCLTSEREGWPNVITESLACGTPVVGTRVGGIPEILGSEDFGVLVDQTVESVANGLELALSQTWDRAAISQRTRARTWAHVALEVQEVLARQQA